MRYAIGKPGEPVRFYLETLNPADATAQLRAGEVALETELDGLREVTAEADGLSAIIEPSE